MHIETNKLNRALQLCRDMFKALNVYCQGTCVTKPMAVYDLLPDKVAE